MSEPAPDGVTPDYTVPVQPVARPRPPAQVWVVCGFLIFLAAVSALGVIGAFALLGRGAGGAAWFGALMAVQVVVYLVVAVFVFRGKSWARWTGIVVAGAVIALSLIVAVMSNALPNCIGLGIQGVILALLLRREVADWCYPR